MQESENKYIILFDGICNFCNGAINFVIDRDKRDIFRYAPLQSEKGKELLSQYQIDTQKTDSIILIKKDKAFIKSSAALEIAKELKGGYSLLYGLIAVPKFIRNPIYDLVAKNRYKWFGKLDACRIPTPELRRKFLE